MRKDFCLLVAMIFIFTSVVPVFGQTVPDTLKEIECIDCNKIECAAGHVSTGAKGTGQDEDTAAKPFDWDARYGYCNADGLVTQDTCVEANLESQCKLVLNICDCDDCEFQQGWVFGVELHILTDNVYFVNDMCDGRADMAAVEPNNIDEDETVANPPVAGVPAVNPDDASEPDQDNNFATRDNCNEGEYDLEFTLMKHETSDATVCSKKVLEDNGTYAFDRKMRVSYYTETGAWVQDPGALGSGKATYVRTPTPYDGYELTAQDAFDRDCLMWIDMPPMIAGANATAGENIVVRARLLYTEPLTDSINPGCDDPDLLRPLAVDHTAVGAVQNFPPLCQSTDTGNGNCDWAWKLCPDCGCYCDKTVGVVGCEDAEAEDCGNCIYFPYVLNGLNDWKSGIGITSLCGKCDDEDTTLTITFTDSTGTEFTYEETGDINNYTAVIDEIDWAGDADPAAGPGWIKIQTNNLTIDGVMLIIQGSNYAGAVLASSCLVCPAKQ